VCVRNKESEINIGQEKSENPKIFAPEIDDNAGQSHGLSQLDEVDSEVEIPNK